MTLDNTYLIDAERFAHETVDGEVIIIDMEEGNYFSMRGTSTVIWELVSSGQSRSGIIKALGAATDKTVESITGPVCDFLQQLVVEQILQEQSAEHVEIAECHLDACEFLPPTVDKYTEMQDLLTLDPIHEVDETGWPNRAETPGS